MPKTSENKKDQTSRPRGRRPFWSGVISFGLVNVPVELFPSVRNTSVSLRMLDDDGTPLSRRYYNPETDELVDSDEIVRGYEVGDDEYVLIRDEELEAIAPKKSREIDLRRFVDLAEIPSLFFERAYFLTPSGESNKAYRLLASVMQRTGRAGIASFVMRGKEYLVAILAEEGILRAQILRFDAEIRSPQDVNLPEEKQRDEAKVKEYYRAIEEITADELDPNELQDEKSRQIRELVEEKRQKNEDVIEHEEDEVDEEDVFEEDSEVDLLETIRQSLKRTDGSSSENGQEEDPVDNLEQLSKPELYEKAQKAEVSGRSKMTKAELIEALQRKE